MELTILVVAALLLSGYAASLRGLASLPTFQTSKTVVVKQSDWKLTLYEHGVDYAKYACRQEDEETVGDYFQRFPLDERRSICHNNCAVVKCKPVISYPKVAQAAHLSSKVSVHILVNEKGRAIYARPLSGHPSFHSTVVKAICQTQFAKKPLLQPGVMHFTFEYGYKPSVPDEANEVLE